MNSCSLQLQYWWMLILIKKIPLFCSFNQAYKLQVIRTTISNLKCDHWPENMLGLGFTSHSNFFLEMVIDFCCCCFWRYSFLKKLFYNSDFILCVWVPCLDVWKYTTCMHCPQRSEEAVRSPGTGVTNGCWSPWGRWEVNPSPL